MKVQVHKMWSTTNSVNFKNVERIESEGTPSDQSSTS